MRTSKDAWYDNGLEFAEVSVPERIAEKVGRWAAYTVWTVGFVYVGLWIVALGLELFA